MLTQPPRESPSPSSPGRPRPAVDRKRSSRTATCGSKERCRPRWGTARAPPRRGRRPSRRPIRPSQPTFPQARRRNGTTRTETHYSTVRADRTRVSLGGNRWLGVSDVQSVTRRGALATPRAPPQALPSRTKLAPLQRQEEPPSTVRVRRPDTATSELGPPGSDAGFGPAQLRHYRPPGPETDCRTQRRALGPDGGNTQALQ